MDIHKELSGIFAKATPEEWVAHAEQTHTKMTDGNMGVGKSNVINQPRSNDMTKERRIELALAMMDEGRLIDTDGSVVLIEVSRELYEEFKREEE